MNFLMTIVAVCSIFGAANCGLIGIGPSAPGIILQGPGSKTALNGPDGSHIYSQVAGGTVVAPAQGGGVVAAPIAPQLVAVAAPAVAPLGLSHVAGLEGQYVHDYTETLYDDGSYKGDGHYE